MSPVPASPVDERRAEALLTAYDRQVRPAEATPSPPEITVERDGPVRRVVGTHRGFVSAPADLALEGDELDALIARQRDFFAARGEAVEWKTRGHDRPADLTRRLRAAGFVPEPEETVEIGMAADLARGGPDAPEGVVVRRTSEDHDLERIAQLEGEVWGEDAGYVADDLRARLRAGRERVAVFVVEPGPGARPDAGGGDRTAPPSGLVAAAWVVAVAQTEFAGLWGGSTLAAWRRRGIYRSLVAVRARQAVAWGARYLQVDASPDSRPILEGLGFVPVTTTTPYVHPAPVDPAAGS